MVEGFVNSEDAWPGRALAAWVTGGRLAGTA